MKYFCLSFDIEEFDLPLELGKNFSKEKSFNISYKGLHNILNILKRHKNLKVTFFVTKEFCRRYPDLIKKLSNDHEIGCHGEHNKDYKNLSNKEAFESLKVCKRLLEKTIKKEVLGFRAPRMSTANPAVLKKLGFKYDASLHPTYVPGRYNNFFKPKKIFKKNGLIIIPTSVSPIFRIPLTWLWFRNFSLAYSKINTVLYFLKDSYMNIYFHPWEFIDLTKEEIPLLFKRNTGKKLCEKLSQYISWLYSKKIKFIPLKELLHLKKL